MIKMNKKGAGFWAFILVILVISYIIFRIITFTPTIPKNETKSNISTIILQYNLSNTTVIQNNITKNIKNITKPKPYNIYQNLSLYPDKRLVQGDILETNKSIICVSGYSSTVRNVPTRVRKQILAEYGLNETTKGDVECDHWYPLENSGSNAENNLWIMTSPYYHWKDTVENLVHKELCSTNLTVIDANNMMWEWYDIYLNNSLVKDHDP